MTSLKLRDGVAATAIGALLMLVLDSHPAHADSLEPDLTPAESTVPSSVGEAGGTGKAWAYWRYSGESTTSAGGRIRAVAPDDQVFQRSGQLVIRTASDDVRWVSIRPAIRIEEACEVSNDGREISCTLPSITISGRLAVRIGTFVAPGAAVTASWTTTSDATLTIDGADVATPLHTFVGSRSTITNAVVPPRTGEQVVEGTAHPGSHIAVTVPGGLASDATAGRDGRWSMTLPEGFGVASVAFTDVSGRVEQGDDFYYNSYAFSAAGEATLNVKRQDPVPRDDRGIDVFIAQLLDAEGNPIAGELIEFTIAGDADLTIRSGVSDRNGEATFTVTSPAQAPYVLNVRSPRTGSEAGITS
jgi:uncharacterized Zn-binding protein involved in type VI secretion